MENTPSNKIALDLSLSSLPFQVSSLRLVDGKLSLTLHTEFVPEQLITALTPVADTSAGTRYGEQTSDVEWGAALENSRRAEENARVTPQNLTPVLPRKVADSAAATSPEVSPALSAEEPREVPASAVENTPLSEPASPEGEEIPDSPENPEYPPVGIDADNVPENFPEMAADEPGTSPVPDEESAETPEVLSLEPEPVPETVPETPELEEIPEPADGQDILEIIDDSEMEIADDLENSDENVDDGADTFKDNSDDFTGEENPDPDFSPSAPENAEDAFPEPENWKTAEDPAGSENTEESADDATDNQETEPDAPTGGKPHRQPSISYDLSDDEDDSVDDSMPSDIPPGEDNKPEDGNSENPEDDFPEKIPELPKAVRVRYKCPKCGTEGTQDADKIANIVTCRKCGRAMRLTIKKG